MEGRVRWFLGLARNAGGYSLPMMGTPCEVPLPRKMNENDMIKIFFRCRLPAYSIQPRMHTDKPNAACAATTDLDCGGKRSATPLSGANCRTKKKTKNVR